MHTQYEILRMQWFKTSNKKPLCIPKLYYYANSGEKNCKDCQLYAEKGTKSPFFPVYVPDQAYDVVSMDFFELMPSGEHKLVVQDLCTKYLAAV